jgi:hypothetical protein
MRVLACFISVLLIAGCATSSTISKYDEYAVVPMDKSECTPDSADISKSKTIVSVARFDDSHLESSASKELLLKANLPALMSSRVEILLHEAGMEVYSGQERESKTLKDMAKKKEREAKKEPKVTLEDYVIMGFLDTVELAAVFEQAHQEREYGVAGKKQQVGPKCKHSATVKGNIKIYDDERRALGNIGIAANRFILEDARSGKCSLTPNVVTLVRETAETAVREAKTKLQNFCPPVGYVLEKRSNGKESIYKISIGESMGVKASVDVQVWRRYYYTNPLTNQRAVETRMVAKGTVTNQLSNNYSWVRLGEGSDLQLGDTVKVVYRDSLLYQLGVGR